MKHIKIKSSLPSWDLSDLFVRPDDPAIEQAWREIQTRADAFQKKYQGKVDRIALLPRQFLMAVQEYETLLQEAAKPIIYASLVFAADSATSAHGAFLQSSQWRYRDVGRAILFFEIEFSRLPHMTATRLAQDPHLAGYAHYLEKKVRERPHRLSEPEEQILAEKAVTGRAAFIRLFDQEEAARRIEWTHGGKKKDLTMDEALRMLHEPSSHTRKRVAEQITKSLRGNARSMGYILNALVQDKRADDRLRKFLTPEQERHADNETDQESVDAMVDAVTAAYPIVHDYYRFKRSVLGVKTLYEYDRSAPSVTKAASIPFTRAREIVLDAFEKFSPDYAAIARLFFDKGWIDAAARPGKRGGAFCQYVTPDLHPYILLNYHGTFRDVLTLAHELGHGIHAYLSRGETYLNFDFPLTSAETASIFAEMLVFDALKKTLTDPRDQRALLMLKIEDMIASVFRQVSMHRFEQKLHAAVRDAGEQSTEALDALWRSQQVHLYGRSVTLTSNYDTWWSYISHFFHAPFYVYAYAYGELLALSLYARVQNEGAEITARYMEMLKAGGSASPKDLLSVFGINPSDRAFWERGLGCMADMVDETKRLQRKISRH